jgi:hypothetical protein
MAISPKTLVGGGNVKGVVFFLGIMVVFALIGIIIAYA